MTVTPSLMARAMTRALRRLRAEGFDFDLIDALHRTPDAALLVVGGGRERSALKQQAERLGIIDRVCFAGTVLQQNLPAYYNVADVLVVASRSEGIPSVVLEALACGTAVLATAVGGIPEVMTGAPAGASLRERSPAALLDAWRTIKADALCSQARQRRRRYAQRFDREPTTQGQLGLFEEILAARKPRTQSLQLDVRGRVPAS